MAMAPTYPVKPDDLGKSDQAQGTISLPAQPLVVQHNYMYPAYSPMPVYQPYWPPSVPYSAPFFASNPFPSYQFGFQHPTAYGHALLPRKLCILKDRFCSDSPPAEQHGQWEINTPSTFAHPDAKSSAKPRNKKVSTLRRTTNEASDNHFDEQCMNAMAIDEVRQGSCLVTTPADQDSMPREPQGRF